MIGLPLFGVAALAWLVFGWQTRRDIARTPVLEPTDEPLDDLPPVSILVPARNEAQRILAESVGSMLACDYPRLEVIAVDDRSTDDTLAILRELAATSPRLRVIAGAEPPPGWLGKVHALAQAQAAAGGEWLIGTDADIVYHPGVVRAAVRAARRTGADVVTLVPRGISRCRSVDVILPVSIWMILRLFPPHATNDPRDPRALGCGGFLMIRREALEAVGGYAAVAGDVADDVGLAERLKRRGYRLHCAMAPDLLGTPMYASLAELFAGFVKNSYRGVRGRWWVALGASAVQLLGGVLPALSTLLLAVVVAAGSARWLPVLAAAGAAWLAMAWCFVPVFRQARRPLWYSLSSPVGFAVMAAVVAESARRGILRRPVSWRGREVPR